MRSDRSSGPSIGAGSAGASSLTAAGGCRSSRATIASSSEETERRMAAAGLFSSCASPAASVPRPASFSRSRSSDSVDRRRFNTTWSTEKAASGATANTASRASRGTRSTSTCVMARTEALRGRPSMADISPWIVPGPTRASWISFPPVALVTSSSPETTTYIASPGSPSRRSRSPGPRVSGWAISASRRRSASGSWANRGVARRASSVVMAR